MVLETRLYLAALVLGMIGVLPISLHLSFVPPSLAYVVMTSAVLCLSAGFVIWIGPIISNVVTMMQAGFWRRVIYGMLKWTTFAIVTILAAIPAHGLVASAMGLPPTDFPLSIAWWTIWFFPLAWPLVVCIATLIGSLCLVSAHFLRRFWDAVPFAPRAKSPNLFMERSIGAMSVVLIVVGGAAEYSDWLVSLKGPALWFAYATEYHPIDKYPGVESGLRSRVHSNGFVSYAEVVNGQVQVRVMSLSK